jgi:hypothetical protein
VNRHRRERRFSFRSEAWLIGAVVYLLLFGGWSVYRAYYRPATGIDETGVVTVISVDGGTSGWAGGSFVHRVRLDSGAVGRMAFGRIFRRGARVWVSYRRYPESGGLRVKAYVETDRTRELNTGRSVIR